MLKLFINAPNVHTGGGKILLKALIEEWDEKLHGILFLDIRFELPESLPENVSVNRIYPTLWKRLIGEWRLRKIVQPGDVVLCLGNLPPLFKLKGDVYVYVQNRYLFEGRKLSGFSLMTRVRITVERVWFNWRKKRVKLFIVQSPTMKRIIEERARKPATVMPFLKGANGYKRSLQSLSVTNNKTYDFLYVASGDPHKNHHRLVNAWVLLAGEGLRPSLCLTIDKNKYPALCTVIEKNKQNFDLNIENVGQKSHNDVLNLYKKTRALIYPSVLETIGLPLIEARCADMPVLASEMDYVRDVIDPEHTFDPMSAISISRAVKRYMGKSEYPLPLVNPKTFLENLIIETKKFTHPGS